MAGVCGMGGGVLVLCSKDFSDKATSEQTPAESERPGPVFMWAQRLGWLESREPVGPWEPARSKREMGAKLCGAALAVIRTSAFTVSELGACGEFRAQE